MAFIVAGIVFIITLGVAFLQGGAAMMSDSPSAAADAGSGVVSTLIVGTVLAAIIASSHWVHFAW